MGKKLMFVDVQGKSHKWMFEFYGDPQYLEEWRADGLTVEVIENIIPAWVVDFGLARPWVFLQDLFNFRNPLK